MEEKRREEEEKEKIQRHDDLNDNVMLDVRIIGNDDVY